MARRRFRNINFRPETRALIEQANAYIDELAGQLLTLRGLYYMFIGDNTLPDSWIDPEYNRLHNLALNTKNTLKNYKRFGGILSDARYAGLLDWEAMEDRIREADVPLEFESLRHRVESAIANFRLPRWEGQAKYVELWVEKDAQAAAMEPIAREYHVPLVVNRGYSSASAMHTAAARICERSDGRPVVLVYLGDHDPSGEDMVRDVRDRLVEFGVDDLEVRKVAITMAQIRRYRPPPNPAKVTDSRARKYIEIHGDRSWEVEALRPNILARLVRNALEDLVDRLLMDAVIERENEGKAQLERALKRLK